MVYFDYDTKTVQRVLLYLAAADENIANAASVVSKEQAIANQEKTIADLENSLAVNEPIYNDYLAQIKALVGDSAE